MRGNNVGDDAGDVVDGAHGAGGLKLKIFEVLYEWDGVGARRVWKNRAGVETTKKERRLSAPQLAMRVTRSAVCVQ